jgi:hypothetical protein
MDALKGGFGQLILNLFKVLGIESRELITGMYHLGCTKKRDLGLSSKMVQFCIISNKSQPGFHIVWGIAMHYASVAGDCTHI